MPRQYHWLRFGLAVVSKNLRGGGMPDARVTQSCCCGGKNNHRERNGRSLRPRGRQGRRAGHATGHLRGACPQRAFRSFILGGPSAAYHRNQMHTYDN